MHSVCYLLQRLAERRPFKSEAGVTAIEYALIASILAMAIVAGATVIGANLSGIFIAVFGGFPT